MSSSQLSSRCSMLKVKVQIYCSRHTNIFYLYYTFLFATHNRDKRRYYVGNSKIVLLTLLWAQNIAKRVIRRALEETKPKPVNKCTKDSNNLKKTRKFKLKRHLQWLVPSKCSGKKSIKVQPDGVELRIQLKKWKDNWNWLEKCELG